METVVFGLAIMLLSLAQLRLTRVINDSTASDAIRRRASASYTASVCGVGLAAVAAWPDSKLLRTIVFGSFMLAQYRLHASTFYAAIVSRLSGKRGVRFTLRFLVSSLLSFVQFWILTNIFPWRFIALLCVAGMIAHILTSVAAAVSGTSQRAAEEKITYLYLLSGTERGYQLRYRRSRRPTIGIVIVILNILGAVTALWLWPIGHPVASAVIAVFHFAMPALARSIDNAIESWRTVTADHIDDDLRNSHLIVAFGQTLQHSIALAYPFATLSSAIPISVTSKFSTSLLLLLPLLIFALGEVIPFFIGLHRFRFLVEQYLGWERRCLLRVSESLTIPAASLRQEELNTEALRLKNHFDSEFDQTDLVHVYATAVLGKAVSESPRTTTERVDLLREISRLQGPLPSDFVDIDDMKEALRTIAERLPEWDIRFAHLQALARLSETLKENADATLLKPYIEARIKSVETELQERRRVRNYLAGTLVASTSAGVAALLKHYDDEIVNIVTRVVGQ